MYTFKLDFFYFDQIFCNSYIHWSVCYYIYFWVWLISNISAAKILGYCFHSSKITLCVPPKSASCNCNPTHTHIHAQTRMLTPTLTDVHADRVPGSDTLFITDCVLPVVPEQGLSKLPVSGCGRLGTRPYMAVRSRQEKAKLLLYLQSLPSLEWLRLCRLSCHIVRWHDSQQQEAQNATGRIGRLHVPGEKHLWNHPRTQAMEKLSSRNQSCAQKVGGGSPV